MKVKRRSVSSLSMTLLSTSEDLALAAAAGFLEVPHSQYPKTNRKLTGKKSLLFSPSVALHFQNPKKTEKHFPGSA